MRTEQERSQLRSIVSSPQWATVKDVAAELCSKIKNDAVSTGDQWESTRAFLLAEGKAQGIMQFLKEVMQEANYEPE